MYKVLYIDNRGIEEKEFIFEDIIDNYELYSPIIEKFNAVLGVELDSGYTQEYYNSILSKIQSSPCYGDGILFLDDEDADITDFKEYILKNYT